MTVHAGTITRTAAQVLVDQLRIQGVTRVFCVPGESYLPVLDALYDSGIQVIVCRNEGGAAMMAEAYGKQTGRLLQGHDFRNRVAPVTALRDVARVAQALHQRRPCPRDANGRPPGGGWFPGKPVAGQ